MSSIRNSIPNRSYRERAQPLSRSRSHPLLEKRKDYKLRAADHKAKQARLKLLRERAAARNPDEFSFKMISAGRAGGPKSRSVANTGGAGEDDLEGRVRREVELGKGLRTETVKLLKTQDAGFLRTVRSRIRRERERLQGVLAGVKSASSLDSHVEVLGGEGTRRHVAYVDDEQEQDLFQRFDGSDSDARDDTDALTGQQSLEAKRTATARRKLFSKQRAKLEALDTQDEELAKAERELELQRARIQGNIGGTNKNGVKFKVRERKR